MSKSERRKMLVNLLSLNDYVIRNGDDKIVSVWFEKNERIWFSRAEFRGWHIHIEVKKTNEIHTLTYGLSEEYDDPIICSMCKVLMPGNSMRHIKALVSKENPSRTRKGKKKQRDFCFKC